MNIWLCFICLLSTELKGQNSILKTEQLVRSNILFCHYYLKNDNLVNICIVLNLYTYKHTVVTLLFLLM